jgi:hypothetical protein
LRIALDEMLKRRIEGVYYFPSFELLRWLTPMLELIWGGDNLLQHVQPEWINYTLSKFEQFYCIGGTALPPPLKSLGKIR